MAPYQIARVVVSSFLLSKRRIQFDKKFQKYANMLIGSEFTLFDASVNIRPFRGQKWLNLLLNSFPDDLFPVPKSNLTFRQRE